MKTYIVLPFKDRGGKYKKALDEFINPFIEYINNNLEDYEIFIVEQMGGSLNNTLPKIYEHLVTSHDEEFFNLGRTINIGYDIIKDRIKDDDIFIFHPVDLLPIDVNYLVNKTTKLCFKGHSSDVYKAMAFKCSDFKDINGFSNNYWGWGWEDTDMLLKLGFKNIIPDTLIDNYRRLSNDGTGNTDAEHYAPLYNTNNRFLNETLSNNFEISGLNTLSYKLISTEEYNSINKYIIE